MPPARIVRARGIGISDPRRPDAAICRRDGRVQDGAITHCQGPSASAGRRTAIGPGIAVMSGLFPGLQGPGGYRGSAWRCCQSKANLSPVTGWGRSSACKQLPLDRHSRASSFEMISSEKVAILVEEIVEGGMGERLRESGVPHDGGPHHVRRAVEPSKRVVRLGHLTKLFEPIRGASRLADRTAGCIPSAPDRGRSDCR